MSYSAALQTLQQYKPKRLVAGRYRDARTGQCCAIGALAPEFAAITDWTVNETVSRLSRSDAVLRKSLAKTGMTPKEARALQLVNDLTWPSEQSRYRGVVEWLGIMVHAENGGTA